MKYFNKPESATFIPLFSYHGSESKLPLFAYHKKSFSEAGKTGINIVFLALFFAKAKTFWITTSRTEFEWQETYSILVKIESREIQTERKISKGNLPSKYFK